MLHISTADYDTLLTPLKTAPKGGGVGFFGDGSCNPISGILNAIGGDGVACQRLLNFGNKKKSAGAKSVE